MATPRQPSGKSLFSLHYLETRLPEWQEEAAPLFAALHTLWHKAQQLGANWNEAQTEDEFVKPVLELLGWSYIPQVKNRSRGRVNRPDYALFADEAAKDAAYPHQGDDDAFYGRALAIAEAKYWGRPLSQKDASGRDAWKSDNNPSHQMVSYLVGTRCAYRTFQANLLSYKQTLDLWVSQHFGNAAALDFLETYPTDVLPALRGERKLSKPHQAAIDRARTLWQEKRFFHWDLEFPEVFIDLERRDWAENPGFDVVIGNPPYVRQEQLTPNKPWLRASFAVYHGVADLYAYFYERGLLLLRLGGLIGIITSNKFLRASYGGPLRRFLSAESHVKGIIDFGHAPIFEDADTFPTIAVLQRPPVEEFDAEAQTEICSFPREKLGRIDLSVYIKQYGFQVATSRFGSEPWSLERPEVDELMTKLRLNGEPLVQYAGAVPYRGILTGFNAAFLIDTATKDGLIQEDPTCAALIKSYLRGQDIKRWTPEWSGLWMILLKSSENHMWPWSGAGENAETVFAESYPALYRHFKPHEQALRKRQDQGRFWWELRSCTYYALFERPKLLYQEIQFHPAYGFDNTGYMTNNKGFLLSSSDGYLLAVLNSPLMWWYNWRYLPHMKDEALSPKGELMEVLPIAPASDAIRAEVEPAVQRLIVLTKAQREITSSVLDWLKVEFDIETPGQRLAELSSLEGDSFIREVAQRRPRSAGRLTPAGVQTLRRVYDEYVPTLRGNDAEAGRLEHQLADLVNEAYQLTPAEVDLLWQTAPPRMPITR